MTAPHTNGHSAVNGWRNGTPSPEYFARFDKNYKGWIIQKFGGTSVGKFPNQIAEDIVKDYVQRNRVAIVCSARSTDTKAEGTTNRARNTMSWAEYDSLLKAAQEAMIPESTAYLEVVEQIRDDHLKEARQLIIDESIRSDLMNDIEQECGKLSAFLSATQIINEISPKSKDIILGVGEKLSCRLMTALLIDKGVDAEYVNLENIIPPSYHFHGLNQEFYDYLAIQLGKRVKECGDKVPVITGFFGMVPGSLLDTVGRGYTDLCAALVAVGVDADELQVWKEVDGIFTADPRKVPTARLLATITPEEAAELTYYGSEVIHPYTMEQVIRARIPIRIKNVENPMGSGTIIFPDTMSQKGYATPPHPPKLLRMESAQILQLKPRKPTAVTTKNSIIVLNIHSNRKSLSHGFFANIFSTLDKYQLVVDLISTSEVHVSMALQAEIRENDLKDAITELRKFGSVDVIRQMTILSLVGKHMRNMVGIAGKMFSTLAASGINIEMISQGASEINISCVIEERDAVKALRVIHDEVLDKTM